MLGELMLGEYLLLQTMRKVQVEKTDVVGVDSFGNRIYAIDSVGKEVNGVPLKDKNQKELAPALRSLAGKGYIEELQEDDQGKRYRITYKGLHVYQPTVLRLITVLLTSVLLPSVVAVISAFIIHVLIG